jgi:site-specific recombinase XerC
MDSQSYCRATTSRIRTLVNLLPDSVRRRRLGDSRDLTRSQRFSHLKTGSAEILESFLNNGRKLKRGGGVPELSTELLSHQVRAGVVYGTLRLLKVTGRDDILAMTPEDAEAFLRVYEENGKRDAGLSLLREVSRLYVNLLARGVVEANPIAGLQTKVVRRNTDYVPQDGIDRLSDISTVGMDDLKSVRDRMIALCLCYDFALRNTEATLLDRTDVAVNGFVEVALRGAVQKGSGKRDVVLRSYLAQTRTLVARYIEMRDALPNVSAAFLVDIHGHPLGSTGLREAVQSVCESLGIRTKAGKVPAPHRLRHSFGTLNAEPIGLSLTLYELMERLRHAGVEITRKVYIDENPALSVMRHAERVRRISGGSPQQEVSPQGAPQDMTMDEAEAIRAVRRLGITWRSLRRHCAERGLARSEGGRWRYSRAFIAELTGSSWLTREEAIRLLGMSRSGYYEWLKATGARTLGIGNVMLVRTEDVRGGRGQDKGKEL